MPIQNSKQISDADERIKELTARLATLLEKTKQIELELRQRKGARAP